MENLVIRVKNKLYRFWFKQDIDAIRQAEYIGCQILVRANEDVGLLILAGSFEKTDLMYLLTKLRSGDIFFDIGANVGLFSISRSEKRSNHPRSRL